jgi:hypothetical protein
MANKNHKYKSLTRIWENKRENPNSMTLKNWVSNKCQMKWIGVLVYRVIDEGILGQQIHLY